MSKKEQIPYKYYNYNFKNIAFYQNKTTYNIFIYKDMMREIKIKSSILNIPFGIEDYNNKKIINLELFNIKSNNEVYKMYSQIKSIELFFENFLKNCNIIKRDLPNNLLNDIKNKSFISCIKDRENSNALFRVHIKKIKKKYLKVFKKKNKEILYNNIKGNKGIFIICLKSLWISENNYGLIWSLDSGVLD